VKVLREHLQSNGIEPALVLCSSSRRTRETLEGVRPGGERSIEAGLYGADAGSLIERLRRVSDDVPSVMVIGHNPAVQVLVLRLATGGGEGGALAEVQRKFPTGALATLEVDCAWSELRPGCARVSSFIRPRELARR
jgi:phosphohistidine phosphatase